MHYALVTIGSRGDVQPFVTLALGLLEKGNQVSLIAHENFREFAESYHLDFKPLTGNVEEVLHSPEARKVLESGNSLTMLKYLKSVGRERQSQVNRDILVGCEGTDFIICGALAAIWVYSIAEKTHKKWAIIQLSFPVTPTREFPFAGMDFLNFSAFNRFTYWVLLKTYWSLNKKAVNAFRSSLGLAVLKTSIFEKISNHRILTLYAVSPAIFARPADWDVNIQITGYLTPPSNYRDSNVLEAVSPTLVSWLEKGVKPFYIGFGSMPVPDPVKFKILLTDLLTQTSHRYIFCHGWSGVQNFPVHDRLYTLPYVNHTWLLSRCKAAIIHGGAGTVVASIKAGLPVIITSIFGDQPWWGKLIQRKMIGIHIPVKKLTAENLIRAIDKTQTATFLNRAMEMSILLNKEDGLQSALLALEQYMEEK